MRHGRVQHNAEDSLDTYEPRHRPIADPSDHKGRCGCGAETSRFVTIGPPGHPENGAECHACGELRLRFEMQKSDPRRI